MSYLHSRDFIHRDTIPSNVLVSNFHYKSYKSKKSEMTKGKKTIFYKLADLGKARSIYTQTNALTGKNCTTIVHRGSLAFMVPELIIQELWIASAWIDELKTIDIKIVSMTFFTILESDQTYTFQIDSSLSPRWAAAGGSGGQSSLPCTYVDRACKRQRFFEEN